MNNQIKHRLIDKILSTNDEKALSAIDQFLDSIEAKQEIISLTDKQKKLLELSEADLQNGDTIQQEELDKKDLSWLRDR